MTVPQAVVFGAVLVVPLRTVLTVVIGRVLGFRVG